MKKNDKNIIYINAVCASRTPKLVGNERLIRMAEANSLEDAFDILRESGFGGSEKIFSPENFGEIIKAEEEDFVSFIKEYAPNDRIEKFCLLEKDFYNAEAMVKSLFISAPHEKFMGVEGVYTVDEIKAAVEDGKYGNMPKELAEAIILGKMALEKGAGGMTVGRIFTEKKYQCLKSVAKSSYLKDIITKEIDGLNISVCLRAKDKELANKMLISCGSLSEKQIDAVLSLDKGEIIANFMFSRYKKLVLSALEDAINGKPLVELERTCSSIGAERMLLKRYTENGGTKPFMLYYYRRKNQIAGVRTVLTGKANDLDKEQIKRRIVIA